MIELNKNPSILKVYGPTLDDIRVIEEVFDKTPYKVRISKNEGEWLIIEEVDSKDYLADLYGIIDLSVNGEMIFIPGDDMRLVFHYDGKNRAEMISQFISLLWVPALSSACDLQDIITNLKGECTCYNIKGNSMEDIMTEEKMLLSQLKKRENLEVLLLF